MQVVQLHVGVWDCFFSGLGVNLNRALITHILKCLSCSDTEGLRNKNERKKVSDIFLFLFCLMVAMPKVII